LYEKLVYTFPHSSFSWSDIIEHLTAVGAACLLINNKYNNSSLNDAPTIIYMTPVIATPPIYDDDNENRKSNSNTSNSVAQGYYY